MEIAERHESVQVASGRRNDAVQMKATVFVQLFAQRPLAPAMPPTAPVAAVELAVERRDEEAEGFVRGFRVDPTGAACSMRSERVGSEELPRDSGEKFAVTSRDAISVPQFWQNVIPFCVTIVPPHP